MASSGPAPALNLGCLQVALRPAHWVCLEEGVRCSPGHAARLSLAQKPLLLPLRPRLTPMAVLPQLTLVLLLTLLPPQPVPCQAVAWAQASLTFHLPLLAAVAVKHQGPSHSLAPVGHAL